MAMVHDFYRASAEDACLNSRSGAIAFKAMRKFAVELNRKAVFDVKMFRSIQWLKYIEG